MRDADSRLQRQTQKSRTDLEAEVLSTSTQRMVHMPIDTCTRTDGMTPVHTQKASLSRYTDLHPTEPYFRWASVHGEERQSSQIQSYVNRI